MTVLLGRTTSNTFPDFIGTNNSGGWIFTAGVSGDLKTIYCHTKVANPTLTQCSLGVYSDNAGNPGSLLGSAAVPAGYTGAGQFYAVLASPVAIVSGTVYHLAMASAGEQFEFQGDSLTLSYSEHLGAGSLPATWSNAGRYDIGIAIWGDDVDPDNITRPGTANKRLMSHRRTRRRRNYL